MLASDGSETRKFRGARSVDGLLDYARRLAGKSRRAACDPQEALAAGTSSRIKVRVLRIRDSLGCSGAGQGSTDEQGAQRLHRGQSCCLRSLHPRRVARRLPRSRAGLPLGCRGTLRRGSTRDRS